MSEILYRLKLPEDIPVPRSLLFLPFEKAGDLNSIKCKKKIDIPPGIGKLCYLNDNTGIVYDVFSGQKAFFMASLFYASGTTKIFFLGTAGALYKAEVGEIVVPSIIASSFAFAGFSPFQEIFCNENLPGIIKETTGYLPNPKKFLTVFSPHEETPEFINNALKKGFECIEMEIFPLKIASMVYQKEFYPLIIVSDLITINGWLPFFSDKLFKNRKEEFFWKIVDKFLG